MKHYKQTVCIPTEETQKQGYNVPDGFVQRVGYFLPEHEMNILIQDIVSDTILGLIAGTTADPERLNRIKQQLQSNWLTS